MGEYKQPERTDDDGPIAVNRVGEAIVITAKGIKL